MPRKVYGRRKLHRKHRKGKMVRKIDSIVRRDISRSKDHRVATLQWDAQLLNSTLSAPNLNVDLLSSLFQGDNQSWTSGDGNLTQGITGLKINALRLKVSGVFFPSTLVGTAGIYVRCIIYEDNQPTATNFIRPFSAPSVPSNPSAYGYNLLQTDHMLSMINSESSKKTGGTIPRLKVLYDKVYKLNSYDNTVQRVNISVNLHNATLNYYPASTGAGSTFYALNKAYYMCLLAYDYVTPANSVTFQGTSRITFTNN